MSHSWIGRAGAVAVAVTGALSAFAGSAAAQTTYENGVTLRTYFLAQQPQKTCVLKSGQTPNVDKLMDNVNWSTAQQFADGREDSYQSTVLARLNAATAGDYAFRLTSDDGSVLRLDDTVVVDHDGLHGDTSKEGAVTLTAGFHNLRIDYIEAGYGQILKLEWKTPGSSSFVVVPKDALSTEAGVVRVTAPGNKYCEGATDTAGDGLRLDTVNPNYTLTDIRPATFQPKVSGMDFLPNGDLVVTTTGDVSSGGWVPNPESGEVYVVKNVAGAKGPGDVTYERVAAGLKNPMGVQIIGDKWYVSERGQLTELSADGADADALMDKKTLATWPNGGNFHEFAFGLIHDADNFYVARSVAINNGGATTDPQPGQNAGTFIKISRSDWKVTTMAGGLRTPNGVGFGPDDQIFVNDNQGAWLPSSKMVHIKPDRFFNHFTNPAGPYDNNPVSAPALWLPQNEIANSPSNPVMIKEGPFKGQMLFGDVTYGGLQRGFLEKVDGEYQGAVFRHSAGLEVGVNRTAIGPDGAIYVGGTGEGGNWGEDNKLRYGLQKLTPNGKNVFDMEKMEVVEGGFRITYTQPISDASAAKVKTAYKFNQWRYVPTSQYGGPKVDEESLLVTDASVSEDKRSVTVKVDGLKPGRVVHARSPRPFTGGAANEELWNTEAWYTLNSLPGYEAPAASGYYEAEEAQVASGAAVQTEHSGYSGSGFVGGFFNAGANMTWQVDVEADGTYPVNIRYANGPNPSTKDKSLALYVNGVKQPNWVFPTTSTTDWKSWAFSTKQLALKAGANQIKLAFETGTDGNVNFDALKIGAEQDICAPSTIEAGYTGLFDGTLESLTKWRLAGAGSFGRQEDCSIRSEGGLGLLWYSAQQFGDYSLKLDWKLVKDDNGGVFVGFPNPGNDPWVAVNNGYEIQIDESDLPDRVTGSIYTFKGADREKVLAALKPLGQWNAYEIRKQGQNIKVLLNGVLVNDFTSTERNIATGYVGVQNHGGGESVWYRNIRLKGGAIEPEEPAGPVVSLAGSFNSELGCAEDWQPSCAAVEMKDTDSDGVYEFSTDKIPAGDWEFKVAHNRSWDENYGADGVRNGADIPLKVAAGKVAHFKYTLATHRVEVTFTNADVTPPTVTPTLDPAQPGPSGGYDGPVTVALAGQDETPGTVTVEYRLDGGEWTAYTAPFQVTGSGTHTVEYRATDATGNVSNVASTTFAITTKAQTNHDIVGAVPPTLSVSLATVSPLGTFIPGVGADYTARTDATVTSTAGQAALTVVDPSTAAPGKLVNGNHVLAQPLQVRAGADAFAPLGASPTALTAFDAPVSGATVPVEFKQSIGANDGLRTGQYSKTLTFTLSTTTP
ncbi:family 16 glycoside hydrolase [Solirubrobacter deserti]|uniref:DUF1080 domain-containing protein n=1 Tax=Solirubrobacter deserti TaxID=2282478 RepID=A0ABT4RLD9_9ACTN|nr:family 16 glycoside hydrolase [Solirubrobacter deserti]MDA0139368.1 DUF1080 domain-containing protein [Solirubrobacter deserti]